jgi:hypothetical protein
LSDLLAAKGWIFVVEGEKDAENLRKIGFVATTNAGGSGKWESSYSESLRGRSVVIVGDNDEPGRKHVEQVTAALHGVAKRVRVIDIVQLWPECPHKGDVSDWLASGGTADKLKAAVEAADDWRPDEPPSFVSFVSFVCPEMDPAAYHGLAGDVVAAFEPHTEADPVAILIHVLTYFGNVIGRNRYYEVGPTKHHCNLFSVLVGESARGRKGTAADCARQVFTTADPAWLEERIKGGLSSGEGFMNEVRDARKEWDRKNKTMEEVDPGISDKRLVVEETEFAGALAVMERHGNNLSPNLRKAWDGGKLGTMTKHSALTATGAHISVVGHITIAELRARLTRTEAASGFANRFLFALVRKARSIPFPENPPESELTELRERIKKMVEHARSFGPVRMTPAAREMWVAVYDALTESKPGLVGAVIARAEAQVVRLATLSALLDGSIEIDAQHLEAALAVWNYCEESAVAIFGDSLGDEVADEILRALRQVGNEGLTRTQISDLFGRNHTSSRLGAALGLLLSRRRARSEMATTGGRAAETWFAVRRSTK